MSKFDQTASIVKGEYTPPAPIASMIASIKWFGDASPLNITFETKGTEYCQYITIWFLKMADTRKMDAAHHRDRIITLMFPIIFQDGARELLKDHGDILMKRGDKVPDNYIRYESIEGHTLYNAFDHVSNDYSPINKKYPNAFWKFQNDGNRVVAFFHTDAVFSEFHQKGMLDDVRSELLAMMKKYDPLGILTVATIADSQVMLFDSKERFDKEFGGQDWMYFR